MSGHSKWSTIKRKKGKADEARGRLFTKLIREITVAARNGGGDIEANARLRTAVATARANNMPGDNIDRAIRKGTGEEPGVHYDEFSYEAFGPRGVALLIQVMTDNKNRTASEVRHILSRNGAHMGEPGSVSRLFEEKGIITVEKGKAEEDVLLAVVLEAGAEDMKEEDGTFEITTEPENLEPVRSALETNGIEYEEAEVARVPLTTVRLEGDEARRALRIVESLEDNDDVQKVFANFDIPDHVMEEIAG